MPKGGELSEEEKQFIAECYQSEEKLSGTQIIKNFSEKFEWIPSASTVSKYRNYKAEPKGDEPKGDEIVIKTKDSRKDKTEYIDISDGEIEEEDFKKIVEIRGTNVNETWRFLQKCLKRGYTKINLETGEIET